jgi:hypothetical protein
MSLPPYDQSVRDFERHFQVVLPDSVGQAAIGFREGAWFRLNSGAPHPVPIRSAIIICPHAAGSIVQIVCWWMRENTRSPRALDLATELALAVGELARKAIEDDPLGMSITTLPSPLPSATGSAFGAGGYPAANPYPAASPYPAGPYPAASPYPAPFAGSAPMAAATTILPQITPEMTAPPTRGMTNPAFGNSSVNGVPRPSGPMPSMPALPGGAPGRPAPQNGGYPGGRPAGGPAPFGGDRYAPQGQGQDGRGAPPPRRAAAPYGQAEQGRTGYGPPEPERDEFFRDNVPPPRRPAPYGQPDAGRGGERSGEYTRPPQRPRADPGRAW